MKAAVMTAFRQPLEVRLHLTDLNARNTGKFRLGTDGFQHLSCWAATAIPPTKRHQQFRVDILLSIMFPGRFYLVRSCYPVIVVMILNGLAGSRKEGRQHL